MKVLIRVLRLFRNMLKCWEVCSCNRLRETHRNLHERDCMYDPGELLDLHEVILGLLQSL